MAEDVAEPSPSRAGTDPGTESGGSADAETGGVGRRRQRLITAVAAVGFVLAAAVAVTVTGWLSSPGDTQQAGGRNQGGTGSRTSRAELPGLPDASGRPQPTAAPSDGGSSVPTATRLGPSGGGAASAPSAEVPGAPPVLPSGLAPGASGGTGPTFSALAGPGCPSGAGAATTVTGGWTSTTGGWTRDGCDGTALAHPTTATGGDSITWRFTVPSTGACSVQVFVPAGGDAAEALYDVVSGGDVGGFTVDQKHNQGRWAAAGTFAASAGPFSVRLTDRGTGRTTVTAASVRVTCR